MEQVAFSHHFENIDFVLIAFSDISSIFFLQKCYCVSYYFLLKLEKDDVPIEFKQYKKKDF
jgi:hypothetical protein